MSKITIELLSEYETGLLGVLTRTALLSWKVRGAAAGQKQLSAQLEAASDEGFARSLATSTIASATSQFVPDPAGEFASREVRYYRVRIETEAGWSDWSNSYRLEAGLGKATDFVGSAIGQISKAQGPATLLRTEFSITKKVASARVYATAHGIFDLMINGKNVGNEYFAPGWTTYQKRILSSTYDVTEYLQADNNAWGVLLGDGWYRGKFGFVNKTDNYGDQTSFLGQLEITFDDGSTQTIATGENWKAGNGGIRMGSIYDGCDFDFNFAQPAWCKPGFDDSKWQPAIICDFDKSVLEPRAAAPVRVVQQFATKPTTHGDAIRIDLGQNISGWLRLKVDAKAGTKITIRHAEVLEPDGKLHTAALRGAKATDTYILATDGEQTLEPKLTFHGFQFADIVVEGDTKVLEVTGIAVSSDNANRGLFASSNELLNKLHSNTRWSLLDNFVSIPTDCPQRDERLGWTGDAQAFAYAAHSIVDGYEFYKSWLTDLGLEQEMLGGKVSLVVPDLLAIQMTDDNPFKTEYGDAGWSDAATVVPWSIYERFGDKAILEQQLDSMRAWVEHNKNDHEGLLIPQRMQLGDWLDPDAPEGQPWAAKVSGNYTANAYMAHSVNILAKTETVLGNHAEAAKHAARFEQLREAIWRELAPEAIKTPTGASIALEFEIAPESERQAVADGLAKLVRDTDARISTGFLGTPVIMDAMSRNGHAQEAYAMLLRTKKRSWLYPITVGATTIWERWEAIHEDGTISNGGLENNAEGSEAGMISFNHYAYGAVIDWMYRNVGGIAPTAPGYAEVSIQPLPQQSLTACQSSLETGFGKISADWKVTGGKLELDVTIPFGVTATLNLPATAASNLTVNGAAASNGSALTHGEYKISLTEPSIVA